MYWERKTDEKEQPVSGFGHAEHQIPLKHPAADVRWAIGCKGCELRKAEV